MIFSAWPMVQLQRILLHCAHVPSSAFRRPQDPRKADTAQTHLSGCRCSQLYTQEHCTSLGVRTVLDLRAIGKACQRTSLRSRAQSVLSPRYWWIKAQGLVPIGLPARCALCEVSLSRGLPPSAEVQVRRAHGQGCAAAMSRSDTF